MRSVQAIPAWFVVGVALWYAGLERVLIPWLHNTVLIARFICLFLAGVVSILAVASLRHNDWLNQRIKPWLNTCSRAMLFMLLGFGLTLGCLYAPLLFAFNLRSNDHFNYKGKTYYYDDITWLDPAYIIDEQTGVLTTKEIGCYYPKHAIDRKHLDEAQARAIVESLFDRPSRRPTAEKASTKISAGEKLNENTNESDGGSASKLKPAPPTSVSSQPLSQQAGQKILDACESPELVPIKNSTYHLSAFC